jgi:hypothetical protein
VRNIFFLFVWNKLLGDHHEDGVVVLRPVVAWEEGESRGVRRMDQQDRLHLAKENVTRPFSPIHRGGGPARKSGRGATSYCMPSLLTFDRKAGEHAKHPSCVIHPRTQRYTASTRRHVS